MEETLQTENEIQRIRFGRRLGAACLDTLLLLILGSIVGNVAGESMTALMYTMIDGSQIEQSLEMAKLDQIMIDMILGFSASTTLFGWIIAIMESVTGATPGKMALGIMIGNDNGTRAEIKTLLMRAAIKNSATLLKILTVVTSLTFISIIGGIAGFGIFVGCFVALSAERKTFHDMLAKTAVYWKKDIS